MLYGSVGRVGLRSLRGSAGFSPAALFASGEQGVWYDPSDFLPNWRLNLFTYSEQFDNSVWTEEFITTVVSGSTLAPNGTNTAETITATAGSAGHNIYYNAGVAVAAEVVTAYSLYVKKNTHRFVSLVLNGGAGTYISAVFDLDGGGSSATQTNVNGASSSISSTSQTADVNGWFRLSIVGRLTSGTARYPGFALAGAATGNTLSSGGTPVFTASGTESAFIWGADIRLFSNVSVAPTYQVITDGVQDYYSYQSQPVMFQDTAGGIPVTAVEQPVGLLLDESKGLTLGSELVTNGNFSGGSTGWTNASIGTGTFTVSSGVATLVGVDASNRGALLQGITCAVGTTYRVTATVSGGSLNIAVGTGVLLDGTGGVSVTQTGVVSFVVVASATSLNLKAWNIAAGGTVTIDNLSVKALPGNHASQSTSASRPVLSARVNLLTYSEQFDNVAWSKPAASVPGTSATAPDGTATADTINEGASAAYHHVNQSITTTGALNYTLVVHLKYIDRQYVNLSLYSSAFSTAYAAAVFDIQNGTLFTSGAGGSPGYAVVGTPTITPAGDGWYRCSLTATNGTTYPANTFAFAPSDGTIGSFGLVTYTGTSKSFYAWGADFRLANNGLNIPPYQRVTTSTDYDASGFPLYLKFDGVDDGLSTATIDPGAINKVQVFAGVRKLSDAATGMLLETSVGSTVNNGSLCIQAPNAAGNYLWRTKGTSSPDVTVSTYNAPITNVLCGLGDISAPSSTFRVNASVAGSNTTTQGTGNYGNYPLFIGARNGPTLFFNGRLYGLIVRFGANLSDEQITSTETWMNGKTAAYTVYYPSNPAELFSAGEQGAWYDPSDFLPNWRLNLLTYSEDYTNAAWVKSNLLVTPAATTAPNSTLTASKIAESTTASASHFARYDFTYAGVPVTFSVYAKSAERTAVVLRLYSAVNVWEATVFDLSSGTVSQNASGASSTFSGITRSIEDVGNGWYRCSITAVYPAGVVQQNVHISNAATGVPFNIYGDWAYVGSVGSGVYIWGADSRLTSNISVAPTYQKITDGILDYYTYQPQPVMFQDSAGAIPVTAVEQPVGLLMDKSKGLALGAELFAASVPFTVFRDAVTNTMSPTLAMAVTGETYLVEMNISANSSTVSATFRIASSGSNVLTTPSISASTGTGTKVWRLTALATGALNIIGDGNGVNFTVSSVSVKKISGNHAYQETAASRPVLSARVNKFVQSQTFNNGAWAWNTGLNIPTPNATTAPDGTNTAYKLVSTSGPAEHSMYQTPVSATDTISCYMKQAEWRYGFLRANFGGTYFNCFFDLQLGVVGNVDANWTNVSIRSVGNGWYQCSATITRQAASAAAVGMSSSGSSINDTGDNVSGIYAWGADIRVANDGVDIPLYQRVGAATDYDTSGFPLYLTFDGTDDSLATGNIDFSAADKMTVFAGLRKLSDATTFAVVAELSAVWSSNNGTFILCQTGGSAGTIYAGSRGAGPAGGTVSPTGFTPPVSFVTSVAASIPADALNVRSNGSDIANSTSDQGTGNYGNYPLYIGRRAGINLPANMLLYSLIVRGAQSSTAQIASTELFVNTKTKAYY